LFINSRPKGADVFINGAKQEKQTPATFPLGSGTFNITVRMPGYEAYTEKVQIKDGTQTQLDIQLQEKSASNVAWAQVQTEPAGAEIFVDGTPTGQVTPARVQIPSGLHNVVLKRVGYQPLRRALQVTEGSTVTINGALQK
jgi:hypothetical protein